MKKWKHALLLCTCLALAACLPNLEFEIGIDGEKVLDSTSSIEEIEAEPSGSDPTYTDTVYPIVLVHGLYGFKEILGIDYWYRVAEALEMGGAEVYMVSVAKANTTEYRGEQLLEKLYDLQAATGASKFHIMGHSHGGPTVRYIIDADPSILASVTTIAGLNVYGSEGSDDFVDVLNNFFTGPLAQGMLNALGEMIDLFGPRSDEQEHFAVGAFTSLSTSGVSAYNQVHNIGLPADWASGASYGCGEGAYSQVVSGNLIRFYSWSGTGVGTNVLDPVDVLVNATSTGIPSPSDGMVEKCSSHFGKVIRDDYDLNHLDVQNWVFGLRRATATNPLSIFRMHANTLKGLGL